MPLELAKAFFSLEADSSKLDSSLRGAEQKFEQSAQNINNKAAALGAAIGGALGSIIGQYVSELLGKLEKLGEWFTTDAVKMTAEFGLEMEHLGARMGMTAEQAATLTGVMERQGLQSGVAARAMQIMAAEARQTTEALDPLNTRLGKVLGTLRDSSGNILDTSQVLDLARQKIQAASGATEQLQLAQQIFGNRMGGQLLPMLKLSNDEWEKQKAAVQDALGPVGEAADKALAYQNASAALNQELKGIQITIGNALLPAVTASIKGLGSFVDFLKKDFRAGADIMADATQHLQNLAAASKEITKPPAETAEEFDKRAKALVGIASETDKLYKLGLVDSAARNAADSAELEILTQQLQKKRELLASQTNDPAFQQAGTQQEILKIQLQQEELLANRRKEATQEEELQIKAKGMLNSTTEIAFLQQQLADSRVVGDERLKIEAEVFSKRQKYEEDVIKIARQLGTASVEDELKFRQQRTADLLQRGDIMGAAGEMKQIQDIRLKEADSAMQFEKKIQVTAISDEISFQKQKLEVVKGNAEEERKILESIADLDKQLYDKRLQFAINYTSNVQGQYDAIQKAATSTGEVQSFAQAKVQSDRQLLEAAREAGQVTHGGGTAEQREAALKFVEFVDKQETEMKQSGQEMSATFKEVLSISQDIKKAAGLETRDVTGPSAAVGSLMSPSEGLATSSLARGSEIPRLDTSFTDLSVRVRDVFLGAIPNIQNFSNSLAEAVTKIRGSQGSQLNIPGGGLGPGGGPQFGAGSPTVALPAGSSSPAQPPSAGTVTVGGQTFNVGGGGSELDRSASALKDAAASQADAIKSLGDHVAALSTVVDTLTQAAKNLQTVQVSVGVDPNSGDALTARTLQTVSSAIS